MAHQIDKDRMQTHLIKCRRNFADLKWVECLFNVTHQVPEQELSVGQSQTCISIIKDSPTIFRFSTI